MKLNHNLKRKIEAIEHRIARLESILQFLREHPTIGTRSNLKPLSTGLMGLVIDGKAFIRPEGVRKEALRLEIWTEDFALDYEDHSDRRVHDDVRSLSDEQLERLLASIPSEGEDDKEEEGD